MKSDYFKPRTIRRPINQRVNSPQLEEGALYLMHAGHLIMVREPQPLSEPLVLKAEHLYSTRDGRQARVLAINPASQDKPVVGLIQAADGTWSAMYWNTAGQCKRPYGPMNDLVDYWEAAPEVTDHRPRISLNAAREILNKLPGRRDKEKSEGSRGFTEA